MVQVMLATLIKGASTKELVCAFEEVSSVYDAVGCGNDFLQLTVLAPCPLHDF